MLRKKIIYIFLIFISFVGLVFFGYEIVQNRNIKKEYNETEKIIKNIVKKDENKIINLQKEFSNNDLIGYFKIENTNIEDVLMQGKNNEFYLNHLPNKAYNGYGSIFIDFRNNIEKDLKVNIYGHTSKKKHTTLSKLENYLNKEYFDKYNVLTLETIKNKTKYKIFSVQIVTNDKHMKIIENEDEYKDYLNNIEATSLYYREIKENISQIITFQTCVYLEKKKLLLVHAIKI